MRLGIRSAFVGMLAVAAVALVAAPASAVTAKPMSSDRVVSANPKVERDVEAVLRLNRGSHRIAVNAVEVKPGVVIRMYPTGVHPNIPWYGCSYTLLCVWTNADQGGYEKDFYTCQNVNLGGLTMPNGRPWNDQISSIVNNQTPGTVSHFYDYVGSGDPNNSANWYRLASVAAGHRLQNLSYDTDDRGRSINDRIDIVHVC
jgi:hypothetical protein